MVNRCTMASLIVLWKWVILPSCFFIGIMHLFFFFTKHSLPLSTSQTSENNWCLGLFPFYKYLLALGKNSCFWSNLWEANGCFSYQQFQRNPLTADNKKNQHNQICEKIRQKYSMQIRYKKYSIEILNVAAGTARPAVTPTVHSSDRRRRSLTFGRIFNRVAS